MRDNIERISAEAAMQRALTSDPEALPMLETLGAARPVTAARARNDVAFELLGTA